MKKNRTITSLMRLSSDNEGSACSSVLGPPSVHVAESLPTVAVVMVGFEEEEPDADTTGLQATAAIKKPITARRRLRRYEVRELAIRCEYSIGRNTVSPQQIDEIFRQSQGINSIETNECER
jgi:hypothetical protein